MSVYVTDEFARVRPRDAPGSRRVAALSAARNEYAPFQIIVRAGTGGLKRVNALAGPLVSKRGHIIAADRIVFYREHYIEVKKLSPKSRSKPGWYPDALIPFLDPSTGQPPVPARFVAAPFDIAPDSNQPLWVDVLTPRDATPGEYTGAITISAEGIRPRTVPIVLTVWDFTLSDTPSMRTYFGDGGVNPLVARPPEITAQGGLDEAGQRALQTAYAELMAAHRICSPIPPFLMPKINADGSIDPQPTDDSTTTMDRTISHHGLSDLVSRPERPGLAGRSSGCGSRAECPISPLDVFLPGGSPLGQDGLHLCGGRTEFARGVQRCSCSLQVRPRGGAGTEGALHKRASGAEPAVGELGGLGGYMGAPLADVWGPGCEKAAVRRR